MPIKIFGEGKARHFGKPCELPREEEQAQDWQRRNKAWWEANPNRYDFDFKGEVGFEEFSKGFYEEIDRRFFNSVWEFMPWKRVPFDNWIDYEGLRDKDVLEIGVGCGSHAHLLAQHAGQYTGIDITEYGVRSTKKRLECFGLQGNVLQMDVESMEFDDNVFDLAWSWGVIHHTSNTLRGLEEIARVLRPGGRLVVMVYHRSFWNLYLRGALYYGILRGRFLKNRSLHRVVQESTDGALARFYTVNEWCKLLSGDFEIEALSVYGSKSQLIPLSMGKAKVFLMGLMPNRLGRLITNRPLIGFLLVSSAMKR